MSVSANGAAASVATSQTIITSRRRLAEKRARRANHGSFGAEPLPAVTAVVGSGIGRVVAIGLPSVVGSGTP